MIWKKNKQTKKTVLTHWNSQQTDRIAICNIVAHVALSSFGGQNI